MPDQETTKPATQGSPAGAHSAGAAGSVASVDTGHGSARGSSCRGPGALWGWSPSPLPADTLVKRRVDRILPHTGLPAVVYFAAVFAVLNLARLLPTRADLVAVGLAALAAGSWCGLNFWRCRHAHCVVTGAGWLALAA